MHQGKEHYKHHRFPGQKENESIQLVIRKHWIIDVKIAVALLMMGVIPLALAITAEVFVWQAGFSDAFLVVALLFTLYFLGLLLFTYIKWLNEELDIIVVTDNRIISHEQIDLFHRQVSEANLSQIQDVTGIEKGFWQSILHYGNIEIQTSASDVFFVIKHVTNPYENARALLDMRDKVTLRHD